MAEKSKRIFTLDLNHKPSVLSLLRHLKEDKAKVIMYTDSESVVNVISVATEWRVKKEK